MTKGKNKHRYCVIMCGGVGSRFWPFSRRRMPKQFLDFFGTGRTLLQMTADRILPLVDADNIILLTNEAYAGLVREQLPEVSAHNILLEPARRNTAPCLCWAARHILAMDEEASMVVLPSDHLVLHEDDFRKSVEDGFNFVENGNRLLTLGIVPSTPNTGYGYIQQGKKVKDAGNFYKVKSFTEKPDEALAETFIESGEFFWNAGIFIWKAESILKAFSDLSPEIAEVFDAPEGIYATPEEQQFVEARYANSPGISVDYAILEKADNVYVETVDFGWSDLGTWKALYEVSPKNPEGNVTQNCKVMTQNCNDCVFAISDDKLVVASDLSGYIVAENDNALLIYPVDREQEIRHVVNNITQQFGEKYT